MTPDDPRHGQPRGYRAHIKADEPPCDPCRQANNVDERRRRKHREALGIVRSVDATGTRRRIHALMAIGWTSHHLAHRCGWTHGNAILEVAARRFVYTRTADTIAALYEQLCMTPGPSASTRRRAERNGWQPPLAWDDIDNDPAPCGKPRTTRDLAGPSHTHVDEVRVLRILGGDFSLAGEATTAERREVVARWQGPLAVLEKQAGWKPERYIDRDGTAA